MKIAIPSVLPGGLEAQVGAHFGHCDCYTLVDVEDGAVVKSEVIPSCAHEHGGCLAPVNYLADRGVTVLLAGGMGMRLKAESLKADRPLLVLWDEPYTGDALRAAGIGVIMADARINQSACTDEGHETFHKKVEGLGFLPNVPLTRTAEDARALADSLVKVSAL